MRGDRPEARRVPAHLPVPLTFKFDGADDSIYLPLKSVKLTRYARRPTSHGALPCSHLPIFASFPGSAQSNARSAKHISPAATLAQPCRSETDLRPACLRGCDTVPRIISPRRTRDSGQLAQSPPTQRHSAGHASHVARHHPAHRSVETAAGSRANRPRPFAAPAPRASRRDLPARPPPPSPSARSAWQPGCSPGSDGAG